jgi:hypothetical protein
MAAKRQKFINAVRRAAAATVILSMATTPIASQAPDRVIVVTLDGFRWQEVFAGADRRRITTREGGVRDTTTTLARFSRPGLEANRRALLPFLWGTVAQEGLLLGDSTAGSDFRVRNTMRFSYPGYNELFTGEPDPRIDSNDKVPNPNVTVLEWLSGRPGFRDAIEVFGSWDVFPFIFNAPRSRLPVNGDGLPFPVPATAVERALNGMTEWLPTHWASARLDAPTMAGALVALQTRKPRVLVVLLGETDEWAHERRYDRYLDAAYRADRYLEQLWNAAQEIPEYRGRTSLVVSVDHGRGSAGRDWTDHGEDVLPAGRIWMAVMGPTVVPDSTLRRQRGTQSQFAATIARLVGEDWQSARPTAAPPLLLAR